MMTIRVLPGHEAKFAAWQDMKREAGYTGKVRRHNRKATPENVKRAERTANKNLDLYAWLADAFYAGQVEGFSVVDTDVWTVGGMTFSTAELRRFATEDRRAA